ncbi:hypothetical protein EHYA_10393 [Embleya hyalina]|uniref:Transposase IS110-like N-terminal domain-containing protein n=1 Tax=Embleya hyalina TaxID=516124 RepID=A0A401Z721_9ACTN|nr:hypothetical protein EHYA_10393 [Embleya hyalina]
MEATSDYWRGVYYVLQPHLSLMLVNPPHLKGICGRKTDPGDAAFLARAGASGMVVASSVPQRDVRELRDPTRRRTGLIRAADWESQRLEKELEDTGMKLSAVLSDITGAGGRAILQPVAGAAPSDATGSSRRPWARVGSRAAGGATGPRCGPRTGSRPGSRAVRAGAGGRIPVPGRGARSVRSPTPARPTSNGCRTDHSDTDVAKSHIHTYRRRRRTPRRASVVSGARSAQSGRPGMRHVKDACRPTPDITHLTSPATWRKRHPHHLDASLESPDNQAFKVKTTSERVFCPDNRVWFRGQGSRACSGWVSRRVMRSFMARWIIASERCGWVS